MDAAFVGSVALHPERRFLSFTGIAFRLFCLFVCFFQRIVNTDEVLCEHRRRLLIRSSLVSEFFFKKAK